MVSRISSQTRFRGLVWVLIDNYDSFTHILHHYLLQAGGDCLVLRNDAVTLQELINLNPSRLILSPGPERPETAGITTAALGHFYDKIPVLGVCLGHQAIGLQFGARLVHAPLPRHGKTSRMRHSGDALYKDIPAEFEAMRYHSLVLEDTAGTGLQTTAESLDDGCIMSVRHERHSCTGIQFHPESVLSPDGLRMLQNWAERP